VRVENVGFGKAVSKILCSAVLLHIAQVCTETCLIQSDSGNSVFGGGNLCSPPYNSAMLVFGFRIILTSDNIYTT
jgi:hypothetical protein